MKKFILVLMVFLVSFSSNVFAGGSSGLVTLPLTNDQGFFMFGAGTHSNKPSCATVSDGQSWAMDAKTPSGKSMQALVMLAFAQGKQLAVVGSGDCNAWGDRERPAYFQIAN